VLIVGAGAIGTQAAGGVRAAQNIIGPINILFLAMENVVPVVAARRYAEKGLSGLSAYLWKITCIGTAFLLPVLGGLAIFSAEITQLLYGASYQSSASLVIWQACSIFLQFYLRQIFFFVRTLSATGVVIRAGILMAIFPVAVAFFMVKQYQETAIMAALLAGTIAGLVYSLIAMQSVIRKEKHRSEVAAS
jgi:O-antigen/teichoic acid export membrane protein